MFSSAGIPNACRCFVQTTTGQTRDRARTLPVLTMIGPTMAHARKLWVNQRQHRFFLKRYKTYPAQETIRGIDTCQHTRTHKRRRPFPDPSLHVASVNSDQENKNKMNTDPTLRVDRRRPSNPVQGIKQMPIPKHPRRILAHHPQRDRERKRQNQPLGLALRVHRRVFAHMQ